jgi:hypothetical protein
MPRPKTLVVAICVLITALGAFICLQSYLGAAVYLADTAHPSQLPTVADQEWAAVSLAPEVILRTPGILLFLGYSATALLLVWVGYGWARWLLVAASLATVSALWNSVRPGVDLAQSLSHPYFIGALGCAVASSLAAAMLFSPEVSQWARRSRDQARD